MCACVLCCHVLLIDETSYLHEASAAGLCASGGVRRLYPEKVKFRGLIMGIVTPFHVEGCAGCDFGDGFLAPVQVQFPPSLDGNESQ